MTVALSLLLAGIVAPVAATLGSRVDGSTRDARRARGLWLASVLVLVGLVHDAAPLVDLAGLAEGLARVDVLGLAGVDGPTRVLVVAALVWCGPAADLLVRRILAATGLPAPEAAAAAGLGAGRWIGRLERWLLVVCVGAGQPALAVIPIGGKALFRYAEVVADARAELPRLARPDAGQGPVLTRDALVDYVIVGSLASWTQAITLGVLVAVA